MLVINGKPLLGKQFDYADLRLQDGRIAGILPRDSMEKDDEVFDAKGCIIVPGLIDLEVHGAFGYDMSDACDEAYDTISRYLLRCGVTSFLGAIDSFEQPILEEAYEAAGNWMKEEHEGARMLGLQMRGPFLNPAAAGAHDKKALRKPDAVLYRKLQALSGNRIKAVSISPELEGADSFIREVFGSAHIALSNSLAGFDEARMGFACQADWCGDLYRNMGDPTVKDPGLLGAAMDVARNVTLRFDNDSIVHPAWVRMAFIEFWERLCLVSGMTAYAGLPIGKYEIEGHTVFKSGDRALFEDGTDAGGVLSLNNCIQASMYMGAVPLPMAYIAATEMPAKALGIFDDVGSITVGKRADLAILDMHAHEVQAVIKGGKLVVDERKFYD